MASCATAIEIQCGEQVNVNVDYESSQNEPSVGSSCDLGNKKGLWYTFTVPQSVGGIIVETSGSQDCVLHIYKGDCSSLDYVDCNDDGGVNLNAKIELGDLVEGTKYYIYVNGFGSAELTGNLTQLTVSCMTLTSCENAIPIECDSSSVPFDNENTLSDNNPFYVFNGYSPCANTITSETRGSWYVITSEGTGTITVTSVRNPNTNARGDTHLVVFEGPCDNLSLVVDGCNDDISFPENLLSTVTFDATLGKTYYIYLSGWQGTTVERAAEVQLVTSCDLVFPLPDNYSCETATEVNCRNEDADDNNNCKDPTTSSTWTQIGFDIDGEAAGDFSGVSVSMNNDGTRVAIGATGNDGNGGNDLDSGHVRVYKYDGDTGHWTQLGYDIEGEAPADESGVSVSLNGDGTRVAIGAEVANVFNGDSTLGYVRVLKYDGVDWTQIGQDIDGEAVLDGLGRSVSLNDEGTRVAIGAYQSDAFPTPGLQGGRVRVYTYDGHSWVQMGEDINAEGPFSQSGLSGQHG